MTSCHSASALVLSLCISATGAAACNGSSTAPTTTPPSSAASFVGTWQGPLSIQGGRTLQLEIAQGGEDLVGRWTLASTTDADVMTGDIVGRVIGSTMALVLTSAGSCPTTVGGTLDTSTRLSGTYNTFSSICPSGASVPIVFERR